MRNTIFSLVTILFLTLALPSCTTVNPGKVGISTLMGKTSDTALESGFHITGFANVDEIDLTAQTFEDTVQENGIDAAQVTYEQTLQSIGYTANIQWRIPNATAARYLYIEYQLRQNHESDFAEINVRPLVREGIKQTFNDYTLRELIDQRGEAAEAAEGQIQALADERLGEGMIVIEDLSLTNIDYAQELEDAFNATIRAQQERELAQEELERERVNMQTAVAQAEANRQAQVERATGEAEAARIEAEASLFVRQQEAAGDAAFYGALVENGVDPNVYLYVQTWNGNVPHIQGGSGDSGMSMPLVIPIQP
jgi:regulator of protease activity HflC (stomatin/prohibitin superfamily)